MAIKLGLPKGRMQDGVLSLLAEAGIKIQIGKRAYRPHINLKDFEVKMLKPQNIIEMLCSGTRDLGFGGADWVEELSADVIEVLDTGLDPVKIVYAAPADSIKNGKLESEKVTVATEYVNLATKWLKEKKINSSVIKTFGATEVFPPEDADCIIDNTATGSTLAANNLKVIEVVMKSSTRLYASKAAMDDPQKKERIDEITLVLKSVIEARKRVIIELNIGAENLEQLLAVLPSMRQPTISKLAKEEGMSVRSAVSRDELPTLIPLIKKIGGRDIVVTKLSQIVA